MASTNNSHLDHQNFNSDKTNKVLGIAEIAIWEYHCQTKKCTYNANWYTIMGYEPFELPMEIQTFFKLLHPEDLPLLQNAVNDFEQNKRTDILDIQYRMKTKSGTWIWLQNKSSLEFDENNNPINWLGAVVDISKLKESENEALSNSQHLNTVVNSLSDIIYEIDIEYKLVNCWVPKDNEISELIHSYKGQKIQDIYSKRKTKALKNIVDQTLTELKPQKTSLISNDLTKFYIIKSTPIFQEKTNTYNAVLTIQDITERHHTQKELEQKKAELYAVIQNTSDVFWAVDNNDKVIVFNQAFNTLLNGISNKSPIIGQPIDESFLLGAAAKRWHSIQNRSLKGLKSKFSNTLTFTDGNKRLYEFHISPYKDLDNNIVGSVITARDIDDIYMAKRQAEKASRLKSKFVSTISHEIRTPLNAILSTCYQLSKANKQEDLNQDIEILQLSSDNLLALINDVLDFTKLSAGKGQINKSAIKLPEFIQSINQLHERLASDKELAFSYSKTGDLPPIICTDKTKLNQILSNVLSNAIKYTNTGHINLSINNTKISDTESKIQFIVSDTGIGISKKEIDNIFESFVQTTKSYDLLKGGTGLGLSITKGLVDLLGGKINVTSKLDKGSTFYIEFTFETLTEDTTISLPKNKKNNTSLRILVAEDNEINAKIITRLLRQWNIHSDLAINGEEALKLAQTKNYNLILMDIQMPVMDGYESAYLIKKEATKYNKYTPIIALTAQPDYIFSPKHKPNTFSSSIIKPFHPESLKKNIFEKLYNSSYNIRKL